MRNLNEVILSDLPTLVQFSAEWCDPCKSMTPIVENIKKKVEDKATVLKIDVDENKDLTDQFRIQTVPTFIIFKQGQPMWRHSGVIAEKELLAMLENYY
mgnify:CR=1 FL=1